MKSKNRITKAKTLMILSVMSAVGKKYDDISSSCIFTLNTIKSKSSKIELKSARNKTLHFFHDVSSENVDSNDLTLLSFLNKSTDILIENSTGSGKIRSFNSIKNLVSERLKGIDSTDTDDSQKLINVLK